MNGCDPWLESDFIWWPPKGQSRQEAKAWLYNRPIFVCDLDGVVVDRLPAIVRLLEYRGVHMRPEEWTDYWGSGVEALRRFTPAERREIASHGWVDWHAEPMDGALQGLEQLQQMGLYTILVTARDNVALTLLWAESWDIRFPFIFSKELERLSILRELAPFFFAEDYLEIACLAAEFVPVVFLMDQPYNQSADLPSNVIRVRGWRELVATVEGIL